MKTKTKKKTKPKKRGHGIFINTRQIYQCESCGEKFHLKMNLQSHRCLEKLYLTEYQLKHEKPLTTPYYIAKLKHSKGRLYWQSSSGNAIEVEEKHCIVCERIFYSAVKDRGGRAGYGLRERKCVTCSKKCSKLYEQFSRESWYKRRNERIKRIRNNKKILKGGKNNG